MLHKDENIMNICNNLMDLQQIRSLTTTLWTHDGDHGIGQSTFTQLHGLNEVFNARDIEHTMSINELGRATLLPHFLLKDANDNYLKFKVTFYSEAKISLNGFAAHIPQNGLLMISLIETHVIEVKKHSHEKSTYTST